MNKQAFGLIVVIGVVVLGMSMAPRESALPDVEEIANASMGTIALHKSPTCGCCGVYGSYIKKMGGDVEVHNTNDMDSVKEELGVPNELLSCHTMEVGGYVVEGHIPFEAIQKLLTEKPDIRGIGMPGMPQGAPGMPGSQQEDFVIYEIDHEGNAHNVFVTL
ncbi:MAG: DUF411 domain-containing protein [bacterium]|nr:DUF411 domain-containing protein [bacterium]